MDVLLYFKRTDDVVRPFLESENIDEIDRIERIFFNVNRGTLFQKT